jgi:predicted HD phosphohydrolase
MMLTSDELTDLIDGLAGLPYGGEAVDQRRHALQCAGQAVAAGADDELVLAAVLHDIGRAEPVRAEFPGLPHEQAGEAFARARVGERVGWLIGQHVPAKRYLVAVALRRWDEAAKDADDPGLPVPELLRIFDRYRAARTHS